MDHAMSHRLFASLLVTFIGGGAIATGTRVDTHFVEPIRLHPDNPHYFRFRGQPTILITAAEHYAEALLSLRLTTAKTSLFM